MSCHADPQTRTVTCLLTLGPFPRSRLTMKTVGTIDELADAAGAGPDIRKYLANRGIMTVPTLALIAKSADELQSVLLEPLFAGWSDGTIRITVSQSEQPIAKAILTHMWSLAQHSWNHLMSASPPPVKAAPPVASPTTTSTTSTSATGEPKVPKSLPPGTWNALIKQYQSIQLEGRDRTFPVTELIGAESVLARMFHELTVSGQFTPILLGEILQRRSFNAAGEVNPLLKAPRKAQTLTFNDDNEIVAADDPVWNPKSLLAVLDGINSIRWAMILIRWGEERHIHTYCDWMIAKARSKPQKGEQFSLYWQWAGWQLAMAMRSGVTFQEATENIMKDLNKFNEMMLKEIIPDKKKPPTPDPPAPYGKGKNSKGHKGKGNPRWSPYPTRDRWPSSTSSWQAGSNNAWWQRSQSHSSQHHGGGEWEKTSK